MLFGGEKGGAATDDRSCLADECGMEAGTKRLGAMRRDKWSDGMKMQKNWRFPDSQRLGFGFGDGRNARYGVEVREERIRGADE